MTRASRIRIGLFLALLTLNWVRIRLPVLGIGPLAGVERPPQLAPLTPDAWWSGDLQRSFERWFARRLPGREHLIRTDNQVSLTLFGQAPSGGTPLVLGRGGMIIEKAYLDEYNRPRTPPAAQRAVITRDLARLGELLGRQGVSLIVVIAPSKAELYPEALPSRAVLPVRARSRTTYELLVPELEAAGITLVDGHRLFVEERRRSETLLFARGGTHWNHYGAALAVQHVLAALERRAPGRFVQIKVTGARVDDRVWSTDDDLGGLLNVWWPRPWPGPQTHPLIERVSEGRVLPRLLFVGDSFTLTCLEMLTGEALMEPGACLYYFNRRIRFPGGDSTPLNRKEFDFQKEIKGLDAVVLVMSEINLRKAGFGFVAAAVRGLERSAQEVGPEDDDRSAVE